MCEEALKYKRGGTKCISLSLIFKLHKIFKWREICTQFIQLHIMQKSLFFMKQQIHTFVCTYECLTRAKKNLWMVGDDEEGSAFMNFKVAIKFYLSMCHPVASLFAHTFFLTKWLYYIHFLSYDVDLSGRECHP